MHNCSNVSAAMHGHMLCMVWDAVGCCMEASANKTHPLMHAVLLFVSLHREGCCMDSMQNPSEPCADDDNPCMQCQFLHHSMQCRCLYRCMQLPTTRIGIAACNPLVSQSTHKRVACVQPCMPVYCMHPACVCRVDLVTAQGRNLRSFSFQETDAGQRPARRPSSVLTGPSGMKDDGFGTGSEFRGVRRSALLQVRMVSHEPTCLASH